ncbi:MAG TPA: hypothetical protein VIK91_19470 [Nannocystis sp.]
MATKYNVHGAQLQISDGAASPTYTTVASLESITLPSETRGSEDVPTHDDTPGGVATKIVDALRTLGTMTFTIIEDWSDPTHDGSTGLYSLLGATSPTDLRVILPDGNGTQIDVTGYITGRTPQAMPANRGVARVDYEFTPIQPPVIS